MEKCYLIDFFDEPISVDSYLFASYIGTLDIILKFDLKSEIKYLDKLGGKFRCFYYIDPDSFDCIYVGFNNVEV